MSPSVQAALPTLLRKRARLEEQLKRLKAFCDDARSGTGRTGQPRLTVCESARAVERNSQSKVFTLEDVDVNKLTKVKHAMMTMTVEFDVLANAGFAEVSEVHQQLQRLVQTTEILLSKDVEPRDAESLGTGGQHGSFASESDSDDGWTKDIKLSRTDSCTNRPPVSRSLSTSRSRVVLCDPAWQTEPKALWRTHPLEEVQIRVAGDVHPVVTQKLSANDRLASLAALERHQVKKHAEEALEDSRHQEERQCLARQVAALTQELGLSRADFNEAERECQVLAQHMSSVEKALYGSESLQEGGKFKREQHRRIMEAVRALQSLVEQLSAENVALRQGAQAKVCVSGERVRDREHEDFARDCFVESWQGSLASIPESDEEGMVSPLISGRGSLMSDPESYSRR